MLARDSFRTETPNVIDPGEGPPPTVPSRRKPNLNGNGDEQVATQDSLETSSDKADDRRRGMLSLSRYGNSGGGIKQSLYIRDGNKGALPKGIPLRFVLGFEDDGDDVDNCDDDDTCDDSQDVIVFERSNKASTQEMPFSDEDTPPLPKKTTTNLQISKNNPFFMNQEEDNSDEENGIAQARLFAAAILNESEKRQQQSTSKRDLLTSGKSGTSMRQLMHRASSFRHTHSSSLRTIHRGSSHRHLPIDTMNNSNSNMSNSDMNSNIWLVDDDIPDNLSKTGPGSSKTNLLWKKLIHASLAVLLGVLLITVFAVAASQSQSQSQSSREGDTDTNLSTAVAISSDPRLDQIVAFLAEDTRISSIETLYDSSSPQFKAAKWLAEEDSEKLTIPMNGDREAASPFNFVQRYVVLVLFFALGGDAADDNHKSSSSWIRDYYFASQDRHECSWYERILQSDLSGIHAGKDMDRSDHETGVDGNVNVTSENHGQEKNTQDAHYVAMGVTCDRELRVKGISLPSNNLRGSLPSEIQYLSALDSLDLRNNSLVGSIPEGLQHLVHLTRLDLSNNRLTGEMSPVYDWIGKPLAQLQVLNLSNNRLDLSSSYDNRSRRHSVGGETRLKTLALGGNIPNSENTTISLVVPDEIRYLTNLRTLSLDKSQIGGRVPAWLFHELRKLEFLDLSHNRLTGSISGVFPSFISGSSLQQLHLKSLLLHDNRLTGTLPESIGMMPDLTTITIHHTNMTVGTNAANIICWQGETESSSAALESLTTDCGDATCPCCIEDCCDSKDCYPDVDWQSGFSAHSQSKDSEDEG